MTFRARKVNNASRESYRTLLVSTSRRTPPSRSRDYGTGTHSSSSSSAVWVRQCQWVMPHAHSHLGTALSSTERADVCISLSLSLSLFSQKGDLGEGVTNERTNDGINILRRLPPLRSVCCPCLRDALNLWDCGSLAVNDGMGVMSLAAACNKAHPHT